MAVSPLATIRYRLAARLLGVPAAKSNPVGSLFASMWSSGSPVYTSRSFEALAREGFENNGYVFRAISIIAQACAGIPWLLYRDKGNQGAGARRRGGKVSTTELDEHPLLDLLAHPHGVDTITGTGSLIEQLVSYYVLSGNSYLTALRPTTRKGPPQELWVQQPGRMRVIPASDGTVAAYRYTVSGKYQDFAPEDVLHWKSFNPTDDWYGLSPVGVAGRIVDQMNSANDWNTALLQNMAKPGGFLVAQGNLPDNVYERLQLELKAQYGAAKNAGRPHLLEGGLDWKQVGLAPSDMDWLEGKKTNVREIAVILGVPSELLGDSTNKTYSNYQEARRSFYAETVLPLMDVLRDLLNAWLVPMYGENGLRLDYDRDDIEALQEDRDAMHARARENYASGLITLNEARDMIGKDALPDGDVILAPPRGLTLDQLLAGVALPPAPTPAGIPALPPAHPPTDSQGLPDAPQQGQTPQLPPANIVDAEKAVSRFLGNLSKARSLDSEEAKAAHWQQTEQSRATWYAAVSDEVAAQFHDEHKAVVKAIKAVSNPHGVASAANAAVDAQHDAWMTLLAGIHSSVGASFAKTTYSALQDEAKARGIASQHKALAPDTVALVDDWLTRVVEMMLTTGAAKVKGITETTRKRIQNEIAQGLAQEETIDQIITRIDSLFLDSIIPNRSEVIARTEVISAANQSSIFGARETGLPLDKEWIATRDGRTREDHADADGQRVPIDQPFVVGGVEMDTPGASGDPAEDCNCRCTQGYHVMDDASAE